MKSSLPYRIALCVSCFPALLSACGPSKSKLDADGDGVADSIGWAVDEDHDDIPDQLDIDYDGHPDGIGVDTNADYEADALGIDTNSDGIIDDVVRSAAELHAWLSSGTGGAATDLGSGGADPAAAGGAFAGTGGAPAPSGGSSGSGISPGTGGLGF